jgi:DNA-binding LacI/PurR family transcriptional regulator
MGILRFLLDEKVRVPEDVSLISVDGIAASEFLIPA